MAKSMPISLLRFKTSLSAIFLGIAATTTPHAQSPDTQWPTYGGDRGGQRFTASTQITPANVSQLTPAWTFHTGAIAKKRIGSTSASFETTPVLFHGLLYLTSPYDEVFAVDPVTGAERWQFDPKLTRNFNIGVLTSRGVATWASASADASSPCAARIFVATMDTRLMAVDAATGQPCTGFGDGGSIDLAKDIFFNPDSPFYNSSPPTVVGNVVIVGSSIGDNTRVDMEDGVVRAFDCVTGRPLWRWEPIPWAAKQKVRTGSANAWSIISADIERGIVYVPTGAPSPDFYGVSRPGDNRDANSVVALEAATGKRLWGFQVVHHDLWDYDVAAQPLLFTFRGASSKQAVPAIAIATKQGLLFILNRVTGEPLFPVTERPVPASDVPGETASPTQPFQDVASLSPLTLPPDAMLGASAQDNTECRKLLSSLRYEGIYTPPSLRGSLVFPGNIGGVNWGSSALDPATGILYANTNRYAFSVEFHARLTPLEAAMDRWTKPTHLALLAASAAILLILAANLIRRRRFMPSAGAVGLCILMGFLFIGSVLYIKHREATGPGRRDAPHFGREIGFQYGTPYTMLRQQVIAPTSGHPCTVLPWGTVSAVNLNTGKAVWQTPLGTSIAGQHTGTPNLGGDIVTASGLLFTAASEEPFLRAFNAATGEELWKGQLPVPAQATPMSYTADGRQYIVIAAGGHGLFGTPVSDAVVAFALPK